MKITFENGLSVAVANERELEEALTTLKAPDNTFFVLERADCEYLQAALVDGAWWIEKRVAGTDRQLRAFGTAPSGLFLFSELSEIASCYLLGSECGRDIEWRDLDEVKTQAGVGFDVQTWNPIVWLTAFPYTLDGHADSAGRLRWLEAWMDYLLSRLIFVSLIIIGIGFVTTLLTLIWCDLFG